MSVRIALIALLILGCISSPSPGGVVEPGVSCPDISVWGRPPTLTCTDAVLAAIAALPVIHPSITTIEFFYGSWCPPGEGCQASRPAKGYVVFSFIVGSPQIVKVAERPNVGVVTIGAARPFPPD